MKSNLLKLSFGVLLGAAMLSCAEDAEVTGLDYSKTEVKFTVEDSTFDATRGAQIESAAKMPSMQVLAYGSDGEDFIDATATENDGVWTLYPAVTWGNITSANFVAYSPCEDVYGNKNGVTLKSTTAQATTISYVMPENSIDQPDLMVATAEAEAGESVTLSFEHVLASLWFRVMGDGNGMTVKSIGVKNLKNVGELTVEDGLTSWSSSCSDANKLFAVNINEDVDIDELSVVASSDNYMMIIPQSGEYVCVEVLFEAADGSEYTQEYGFTASTDWRAGKSYTYNLFYDAEDAELVDPDSGNGDGNTGGGSAYEGDFVVWDFTKFESSNCYIVNPSLESETAGAIYYIPVEERIDDYYANYAVGQLNVLDSAGNEWSPKFLWCDVAQENISKVKIERVTSGFEVTPTCTSALKVTVPAGAQRGNYVVVLEVNNTPVWTWHFWVTDYSPYYDAGTITASAAVKGIQEESVTAGNIHRYLQTPVFQSGGIYEDLFIMDRNIGARSAGVSHVGAGGAVFYQWGRKDPFPGRDGKFGEGFGDPTKNAKDIEFPYRADYNYSGYNLSTVMGKPDVFIATKQYGDVTDGGNGTHQSHYDWCSAGDYDDNVVDEDAIIWRDKNVKFTETKETDGAKKKSIFDPSPWGWRVHVSAIVDGWSKDDITKLECTYTYLGKAIWPCESFIGAYYNTYQNDSFYFPFVSSFSSNRTWCGEVKGSWPSSKPDFKESRATALYLKSYSSYPTPDGEDRILGFPVRSVQETTENPYETLRAQRKN